MNHMKYRICLLMLVLAATLFGVVYYVSGQEKQGPYPGGTLVEYRPDYRETEYLQAEAGL